MTHHDVHHPTAHLPRHATHRRARRTSASTRRFVRHYAEMVAAMFLGMAILGVPAGWAPAAVGSGWSELNTDTPSLVLLGMAVTMTVPMLGWMRYRGHGWRANTEMSASMLIPTLAGALLIVEHVAMLLGMLGAGGGSAGEPPRRAGHSS